MDNYYKMELKCNSYIVENITKAVKKMKSQGNGRTLSVTHNATVPRYKKDVWFSKDTITNSISLKTWLNNIEEHTIAFTKYSWCKGMIRENKT